jgi:hypothetical protein
VVGVGGAGDESEPPASGQVSGQWPPVGTGVGAVTTGGGGRLGGGHGHGWWRRLKQATAAAMAEARQREERMRKWNGARWLARVKISYVRRLSVRPSNVSLCPTSNIRHYFRGPAETVGHKLIFDGAVDTHWICVVLLRCYWVWHSDAQGRYRSLLIESESVEYKNVTVYTRIC